MEKFAPVVDAPTLPPETRVQPSLLLARKLEGLRRKAMMVAAGGGLSRMVSVAVLLLGAGLLLDWWLDLPWGVRALLLAMDSGIVGWICSRHILRPVLARPDHDALALMVEKARPEFGSRLISAIQLTRPGAIPSGASPELVCVLVAETETLAAPVEFTDIIETREFKHWAVVAAVIMALGLFGFARGGSASAGLLQRALLSNLPVPRKTRVVEVTGNKTIGVGETIKLEAKAAGIIPGLGQVVLKQASGRSQEFTLEADRSEPKRFSRRIENVQDSFTYVVRLNDGISERYRIEAVPPPTLSHLECRQVYPTYTGLGTVRRAPGDLSLLAGSQLQLKAAATKAVKRAMVRLIGLDQERPMPIAGTTNLAAEFTIPTNRLTGFSINLTDEHGVQSKDPVVYQIDLVLDRAPAARITYPERKEELVTQLAAVLIGFEANDDFGIGKVLLRYKISTLDADSVKSIELGLDGETPKSLRRRFEWQISALKPPPPEGSVIEYWVEVTDTNDATGPGVGASDHQVARVVSETEKRADLMSRVADSLSGVSSVATDQERLNETLGRIIKAKP